MAIHTVKSLKHDGHIVQVIDTEKKRIVYNIVPGTGQARHYRKIVLEGFTKLPSGFYKDGFGISSPAASYLLRQLSEVLGMEFDLSISATAPSDVSVSQKRKKVVFYYPDFNNIQRTLRALRTKANYQSNASLADFLKTLFPDRFASSRFLKAGGEYEDDKLSSIIYSREDIADHLSKNDVTAVGELYSKLIAEKRFGETTPELKIIDTSRRKSEKILLENVIRDFERRLKQMQLSENDWQNWFQKFILLFNTSYVQVIEKLSVSLAGKYPDFMLLNVYNYLDIYEIKKPSTKLLKRDDSRGNFFWDTEICKAMIQTENYIDSVNKNAYALIQHVNQSKGLSIKVMRPRGFIIAGTRTQLENGKKQDDFRLLSGAAKNVDVILYDDLLQNLKNLMARL